MRVRKSEEKRNGRQQGMRDLIRGEERYTETSMSHRVKVNERVRRASRLRTCRNNTGWSVQ